MAASHDMKLVEECTGVGALALQDETFSAVPYQISRYQAMARSGLPVPGLHRIEGTLNLAAIPDPTRLINRALTLQLEDGRSIQVSLADASGRVLTEGHGPSRCTCC